jgi:hypothetical protein
MLPDRPYPEYVYRYIDFKKPSYVEDLLRNNSLYFAFPSQFIDKLDCKLYQILVTSREDMAEILRDEIDYQHQDKSVQEKAQIIEKLILKYPLPDDPYYQTRCETLNKVFKRGEDQERVGVLCLTERPNNTIMWKEYVSSGNGVCVQLSVQSLISFLATNRISNWYDDETMHWFRNIEYIKDPITFYVKDFFNTDPGQLGVTTLYTKHKSFSFEEEWRFIIVNCINQKVTFPEEIIEKVWFGPKTTKENVALVEKWNKQRKRLFEIDYSTINKGQDHS